MKSLIISVAIILCSTVSAYSQTTNSSTLTTNALIASTEKTKSAAGELLRLQQADIQKKTSELEQLRQLFSEGLIARVEVEAKEQEISTAKSKLQETSAQIASADQLALDIKKAAELAKNKPLVKPTLMRIASPNSTVLRSNGLGEWSLASLSTVQGFFLQTFGRGLPISAFGQSATHNKLGWDHRNAVDINLHPDSAEGRALIAYLQSAGIPFLAFRSAIPGVATGPHIHIGNPSHRLA